MPQMAPMMWCALFFYFTLLLGVMVSSVFFSGARSEPATEKAGSANKMSWKW